VVNNGEGEESKRGIEEEEQISPSFCFCGEVREDDEFVICDGRTCRTVYFHSRCMKMYKMVNGSNCCEDCRKIPGMYDAKEVGMDEECNVEGSWKKSGFEKPGEGSGSEHSEEEEEEPAEDAEVEDSEESDEVIDLSGTTGIDTSALERTQVWVERECKES